MTVVPFRAPRGFPMPVAYWPLCNSTRVSTTPATLLDEIGGMGGEEIGAPVASVGQIAQARSFDGAADYINLVDPFFDFVIADPISVSCWMRTSTSTIFLGKRTTVGPASPGYQFGSATTLGLLITDGVNIIRAESTANTFADGTWHHAVITYDGSTTSPGMSFYQDGADAGFNSLDNASPVNIVNAIPAAISASGGVGSSAIFFAQCELEEVTIWDRELTAAEVFEAYSRGARNLPLLERV